MAVQRRTSREEVMDAALRVVDTEGLDALTMRRIGDELGIPVMTLYGFVRTKEEILDALPRTALADLIDSGELDGTWAERLTRLIDSLHRGLSEHPGVLQLILAHGSGGSFDPMRETIFQTLHDAGFDRDTALDAMGALVSYAVGFAVAEGHRRRIPAKGAEETARLKRLHPDEFPRLYELAEDYPRHISQRSFEAGLKHLVAGFEAQLHLSAR